MVIWSVSWCSGFGVGLGGGAGTFGLDIIGPILDGCFVVAQGGVLGVSHKQF